MEFIRQAIPDILVIEPKVYGDQRGYFVETFRQDKFEDALGYKVDFIQDNESKSSKIAEKSEMSKGVKNTPYLTPTTLQLRYFSNLQGKI